MYHLLPSIPQAKQILTAVFPYLFQNSNQSHNGDLFSVFLSHWTICSSRRRAMYDSFYNLREIYPYLYVHHKYLPDAYYLSDNLFKQRKRPHPCPQLALEWKQTSRPALRYGAVEACANFTVSIAAWPRKQLQDDVGFQHFHSTDRLSDTVLRTCTHYNSLNLYMT